MCRYTCCGCGYRQAHRVLGYELVNTTEEEGEEKCTPFVRITMSTPTISDGFLCLAFRSIPTDSTSYPIKVEINDSDVDVVNRSGRTITTADLYECIMLSGIYNQCENTYTIC